MSNYTRVIPRDLFNESKLLKCLGQLSLLIHDGCRYPLTLRMTQASRGFIIHQNPDTGGLFCVNLHLEFAGVIIPLHSVYNSKDAYPLLFILNDYSEEAVFDDAGKFSDEFTSYLELIQTLATKS